MRGAKIMMRTTFSDWREVSYKKALDYARWKMGRITMGNNDKDRVAIINKKFKGIVFSEADLK